MKEEVPKSTDLDTAPVSSLTSITLDQLRAFGVSRPTAYRKLSSGEWKSCEIHSSGKSRRTLKVLISSLPVELQLKWLQQHVYPQNFDQPTSVSDENDGKLLAALLRFSPSERHVWLAEAVRLLRIVARYDAIKVKRRRNKRTGMYEYVQEVHDLCREAVCKDSLIIAREPHRASTPSPHTLQGWSCRCEKFGLLTFIRCDKSGRTAGTNRTDRRRVTIPPEALEWINTNWHKYRNSRSFYKAYEQIAKIKCWKVPSESWFFRLWSDIPVVVKVLRLEGRKAYESKLAPYVPRDYFDLQALQILCGDHSERDVTVCIQDGTLRRPWVTLWYDLRTGLIWGWHVSVSPSAYTAGVAYADGVRNFGAQPFSRPDDGFFSYILTDRGRDYRSHNWDGREIAVHKEAMRPDGGFELLLVQYRVGIVEELDLKHLLTRGRNPKENPVERVHRVISEWEQNTFDEYCGRDPRSRPERWHQLYAQHQQFKKGKRNASPFMGFDQYREALADFIVRYNSFEHERLTLGGARIIPLEEYSRLYTTRYEISSETLSLLLMKAEKRRVRKNGVQCFRKDWFYYHEAMSLFKGQDVEVRFSDDDYSRVFVVLPNRKVCEAELITPTSLVNPNKETLRTVKRARAFERGVIKDFNFIARSNMRGEALEDRVSMQIELYEENATGPGEGGNTGPIAVVHKLTRLDQPKHPKRQDKLQVTAADVANTEAYPPLIVPTPAAGPVTEFDYED